jgi:5'-deoxynucleotidase YfbR-like HD superfamily hydrolase
LENGLFRVDTAKSELVRWDKLIGYRRGTEVSRWHTQQPIFPETVGHHSANVALLCDVISEGECSRDVLFTALIHDLGEFWTGDVPAPAKVLNPSLKDHLSVMDEHYLRGIGVETPLLSAAEISLVKAADILDLLWVARLEVQVGNTAYLDVLDRGFSYLEALQWLPAKQQAIVNNIANQLRIEDGSE